MDRSVRSVSLGFLICNVYIINDLWYRYVWSPNLLLKPKIAFLAEVMCSGLWRTTIRATRFAKRPTQSTRWRLTHTSPSNMRMSFSFFTCFSFIVLLYCFIWSISRWFATKQCWPNISRAQFPLLKTFLRVKTALHVKTHLKLWFFKQFETSKGSKPVICHLLVALGA